MKIAYIVSLFPKLSETFILREILSLEERGYTIAIVSLKKDLETIRHRESIRLADRTWYPRVRSGVIRAAAVVLIRHPFSVAAILWRIIGAHWSRPELLAKSLGVVPVALAISAKMKRDGIDHIHAHWASYPALVAWIASRLTHIPYSVTGHAHDLFLPNPMLCDKLRDSAFFATISEFNRALLVQACGPGAIERIELVRCGIPLEVFARRPGRDVGVPPDIVSVGRLVDYKGFDVLIRALALLRDERMEISCQIIGEGPERLRLEQLIEELRMSSLVELTGGKDQDEVRSAVGEADLLALACVEGHDGQKDGIPIVLMEAMALGVPVISTKLSGIPELIKDGKTGLLVAPGDAEQLSFAIRRVLEDPQLGQRLCDAARLWVETEFDLRRSVEQLAGCFDAARRLSP